MSTSRLGKRVNNKAQFSPPLGRQVVSSPTERIQGSKQDAKAPRCSDRKTIELAGQARSVVPPSLTFTPAARKSKGPGNKQSQLLADAIAPSPIKRDKGYTNGKQVLVSPNVDSHEASSDEDESDESAPPETPTKIRNGTQPPISHKRQHTSHTINAKASRSKEKTQDLKPIPFDVLGLKQREFKPAIIRDGVSEHAIKGTAAKLEKKIAARKTLVGQNQTPSQLSFKPDWSIPVLPRHSAQALEAELRDRGIHTDRQYGNFWYNLQMSVSKAMGSPVPLFSAHKKSLELVVEESMKNERKRHLTKARQATEQQEAEQVKGVEAFKLYGAGETDEESSSLSESEDGEELITKMQDNLKKQRSRNGVGTSLGR